MTLRMVYIGILLAPLGVVGGTTTGLADALGERTLMPTDAADGGRFPANPAWQHPGTSDATGLVGRTTRKSKLEAGNNGGRDVSTAAKTECVAGGALFDVGSGMSAGVTHGATFYRYETDVPGGQRDASLEVTRVDETSGRVIVELTAGLNAAVIARYLRRDVTVLGDNDLRGSMATRYKASLFGYAAALDFAADKWGVGYAYEPPLHGKTRVEGEDRIVVEPGRIVGNLFLRPGPRWTVGIVHRQTLNEVDDLAKGTTAADDQTGISLYGLDPEQYVIPDQLTMVGAGWDLSGLWRLKIGVGEESALFNFADYARYDSIGVRQSKRDRDEGVKSLRYKAALVWQGPTGVFDVMVDWSHRQRDLPSSMNGGAYDATSSAVTVAGGVKI